MESKGKNATKSDETGKNYHSTQFRYFGRSRAAKAESTRCGMDEQRKKTIEENQEARKKLKWASFFCLIFMTAEVVGGFYANSLAIITDAAHLLSDLAGFLISIFALWLGEKSPTSTLSFGFHRAEILGALMSVLLIWLLTGLLIFEAAQRVQRPEHVDGRLMFFIAAVGLVVNFVMGVILHQSGHGHSHGLSRNNHGHSHGGDSESESHLRRGRTTETERIDIENGHGNEDGKGHNGGGDHSHSHGHSKDKHSHSHGSGQKEHGHGHGHGKKKEKEHVELNESDHEHDEEQESENSPLMKKGHAHAKKNINVSAAFIHVLGDALQSVGVMIAAGLIWYNPKWTVVDPVCTFLFSIIVLCTTIRLIKESVSVLMEGSPEGIDPTEVETALKSIKGVLEVHDLHIWSLSVGTPSLSVHLLADQDASKVLESCQTLLGERWSIFHTTIQVESKRDQIACNIHYSPGPNVQTLTTS